MSLPNLITRLAPSPTGALHLGNARTFLANWLFARQNGWHIILRIEDLDGPRVKPGADRQLIEDLHWLGLDWDSGPIYQSDRLAEYQGAIDQLIASNNVYPCVCTRKEIELAASAPHAEDGAVIYPGTCRGEFASSAEAIAKTGRTPALRFAVPAGTVKFVDGFRGCSQCDVAVSLGDFVVAKADRTPAYQLAVVVDDVEMGVTDIVRGDDLLESTFRQILIYRALGWGDRIPRYDHLPLVVGPDGRRLAKRHGDTRLVYYREQGASAARVLTLLARWLGITGECASARDLVGRLALFEVPRGPIVFEQKDHEFLLS